jgi:hypothetical protein
MNTHELKQGDRVRVRADCPDRGHHAGDKGTVLSGPHSWAGDEPRYYVMMDNNNPNDPPSRFFASEIEPDV